MFFVIKYPEMFNAATKGRIRMKKICSLATALVMAITIFAIPTFSFAGDNEDLTLDSTEPSATEADLGESDEITDPTNVEPEDNDINILFNADRNNDSNEEPEDSEAVAPTVAAPGSITSTPGTRCITFSWSAVEGADGYAYSRYGATSPFRDNKTEKTFTWGDLNTPVKRTFYVRAYKNVPENMDPAVAENLGAEYINPYGSGSTPQKLVFLSEAVSITAQPKVTEKMVRTKYSKGYYYRYYQLENGKWVEKGTSYAMWNAVRNAKSKTKYLIAMDVKRNNVVVYIGKKGNWRVYKHFVVATGKTGKGKTTTGTFKIFKRKVKFHTRAESSKKGLKYTCWYATRWNGAKFFHSVLYQYNSKKRIHDGDVGIDKSHGCVRMKLGDAKWIYKNCKNGTTVISQKNWTKMCSYGTWNWSWNSLN